MLTTKNIALNLYSFGYYGGFIKDKARQQDKLDIGGLLELVRKYNLGGIEVPFDHFYNEDQIEEGISHLEKIRSDGFSVFLDLEKINPDYIRKLLPYLSRLDVHVIRIKMDQIGKTIYGGNRYTSDTFHQAVHVFKNQLKQLVPDLKQYKVAVAIENHQDFHSSELAELIEEISPEWIGITWDVGNSASVLDSPESFYKNVGPYIRNVHLKDYHLLKSETGMKMLRCPFGDGYVDYKSILPMLAANDRIVNMSIELGAQITRECDLNVEKYWSAFEGVAIDRGGFLDFLDSNFTDQTMSDQSHYESGLDEQAMIASELNDIHVSLQNLNNLLTVSL